MAEAAAIETRTYDQIPKASAISPDALVAFQEEGGPLLTIEIKKLLGRLIQTDTLKETKDDPEEGIMADLDHEENSVGLVYADPDAPANGWYRKIGAPGEGTWLQFEKLSNYAAGEVEALIEAAQGILDDVQAVTGSHVIAFGVGGEGQAVHGSALAAPAARYAATVDGNNYLNIEFIAAAVERVGWLKRAAGHKVGRTFSLVAEFPVTNFGASTAAAVGFAFSDKAITGANANLGADAVYLYIRNNAVAQLVNDAGAAVAGYTLTVGTTAIPAFTGGDIVTTTYRRNANVGGDDTATLTFQKGATIATVTITPAPPQAFVVPIIRSPIGGSGAAGNGANYHAKMRSFRWDDATIEQNVSQITQQQFLGAALPSAVPTLGSPMQPAVDALANIVRQSPTPLLGRAAITPVQVIGPGKVVVNRTGVEAMAALNPAVMAGSFAYVSPTGGAPGTAALADRNRPYSLAYALKTLVPATVLVALPGDYDPIDFRNTDAAGAVPKLLLAEQPGRSRLRQAAAESLSTMNWTPTGGYAGIQQANYVGVFEAPAGVPFEPLHRIMRRDRLDRWGYPEQLLRCASLAALDAVGQGFYIDTATKTIYIKLAGGISVEANKAFLVGKWKSTGATSRLYVQGAILGLSGFVIDGLEVVLNVGAGIRPQLYFDQIEQLHSINYGMNDLGGVGEAYVYGTRWRAHSSAADDINLGEAAGLPGVSFANIADFWMSDTGAFAGLGPNGTANKQGISMHGGNIMAYGGLIEDCYGQCIADTSTGNGENLSHYVGILARRSAALAGSVGFGLYGKGAPGADNRRGWLDTCAVAGPFDAQLHLQDYARAKLLNSNLIPSVQSGSVAPIAYTADNPGA